MFALYVTDDYSRAIFVTSSICISSLFSYVVKDKDIPITGRGGP
jgi:hypothetical protein